MVTKEIDAVRLTPEQFKQKSFESRLAATMKALEQPKVEVKSSCGQKKIN